MIAKTYSCQNCQKSFQIEPEDFAYYERIKVPPPTWCPPCRLQRRAAWINIFQLYKRPCDLCKKDNISIFPPGAPYVVYCPECWWGDGWDSFAYGRDYDFGRPFFDQLEEQLHRVPHLGLAMDLPTTKSSPYNNQAGHLKNCYLTFFTDPAEDCAYGFYLSHNRQTFDTSLSMYCEPLYDSRTKITGALASKTPMNP